LLDFAEERKDFPALSPVTSQGSGRLSGMRYLGLIEASS
jgi:hypothetical protein